MSLRLLLVALSFCCLFTTVSTAGTHAQADSSLSSGRSPAALSSADPKNNAFKTLYGGSTPSEMPTLPAQLQPQLSGAGLGSGHGPGQGQGLSAVPNLTPQNPAPAPDAAPALPIGPRPAVEPAAPEPSRLEHAFNAKQLLPGDKSAPVAEKHDLAQFGYSFFENASQLPLTAAGAVSGSYPIAPRDHLLVSVWGGGLDGSFDLEVSSTGTVVLPRVGALQIWGTPFNKAAEVVRNHLLRSFKDIRCSVELSRLHPIRVSVVGEAETPGSYDLNALSSVMDALVAADGPTKNGSLRSIAVRRGGTTVAVLDLYQYLLLGNGDLAGFRLQDGDVISVPVIGKTVAVRGEVKRPGIYEIVKEQTLSDVVQIAGGLTPTAFIKSGIVVSRIVKGGDGKVTLNAGLSSSIEDMDAITVPSANPISRKTVRLEGYVVRPGSYAYVDGMKVSALIGGPENLLPEYYAAAFDVTRVTAPEYKPSKIVLSLAEVLSGKSDFVLQDQDTVRIYSNDEREEQAKIRVSGEVLQPGTIRLYEGMTVREALLDAGNPKRTAFLESAEISRIVVDGGEVRSKSIIVNLARALKGDPENNIRLQPFDEIIVRRLPNWTDDIERYVEVRGEVVFPGIYPIFRGEKVDDLLRRAGGFSPKAYPQGAKYTRRSIQSEQQLRMTEMIATAEYDLSRKQAEAISSATSKEDIDAAKTSMDTLKMNLERLKKMQAEGRMVIDLAAAFSNPASQDNVEVVGGDIIDIPQRPGTVNIMGQVYRQTAMIYQPGRTVSHYLKIAGGASPSADLSGMYLVRCDGSIVGNSGSWFRNKVLHTDVEPGDTIIIPQDTEKTPWMKTVKDVTTIISQVALTAGVVLAAGL